MTKEQVSAADVLESVKGTEVKPTFVQKAGLLLAAGVGVVIALVTRGVVYFLIAHYPTSPTPQSMKELGVDGKVAVEEYKELSAIALKSAQAIFQTIVSQALLPVFTAILEYIFAKGDDNNS